VSRTAAFLVAAVALSAAGCQSQWVPGVRREDIARTDVVVTTTPAGATIFFNDKKMIAPSPIRIPVEYTHAETMWERQSNYGARMREDMSTVVTVLTFPVWGIASFFHFTEKRMRHEYGGNVHHITTYLPGYEDSEETITLQGEADRAVELPLVKIAK
jgi:hypothetical protein